VVEVRVVGDRVRLRGQAVTVSHVELLHNPVACRAYAFDSATYRAAVALREAVLRAPLGLAWRPEDFAAEDNSFHLGAFLGDRLVGTLILRPRDPGVLQMRQVAVAPDAQGAGVGAALVAFAEAFAAARLYDHHRPCPRVGARVLPQARLPGGRCALHRSRHPASMRHKAVGEVSQPFSGCKEFNAYACPPPEYPAHPAR
jgi:GNAT superfamily N-acetyltransferase